MFYAEILKTTKLLCEGWCEGFILVQNFGNLLQIKTKLYYFILFLSYFIVKEHNKKIKINFPFFTQYTFVYVFRLLKAYLILKYCILCTLSLRIHKNKKCI